MLDWTMDLSFTNFICIDPMGSWICLNKPAIAWLLHSFTDFLFVFETLLTEPTEMADGHVTL